MPGPSNRAALNEWFAAVDDLLAEERDHAISPSTVPSPGTDPVRFTVLVADLAPALTLLLDELVHRAGRWLVILQSEGSQRYVQFLVCEDGSLLAEASSNKYLNGDERLSDAEGDLLGSLRWKRPGDNWLYVDAEIDPSVGSVVELVSRTFEWVFGLGPEVGIGVKVFSSPRRGRTPASTAGE